MNRQGLLLWTVLALVALPGQGETDAGKVCKVLADSRLETPLRSIAAEYGRRTGVTLDLEFLPRPR